MGGNNIDTPKRKVSIKNHLSELLLVFPHTEASRGKSEIIRRASKLAFITWLQTQTTTTTNNRLFISKALIWCIMYLIWLLLPRIGSILNNSWLTLGKKKKKTLSGIAAERGCINFQNVCILFSFCCHLQQPSPHCTKGWYSSERNKINLQPSNKLSQKEQGYFS